MPGTGTAYLTQARYDVRTPLVIAANGSIVPVQRAHSIIGVGGAGVADNLDAIIALVTPQDGDERVFFLTAGSGPITVRHRPATPPAGGTAFNLGSYGTRFVMSNPRSSFTVRFNAATSQWDVVEVQNCEVERAIDLDWVFGVRGKPGIAADILNAAEATRMVTDPAFMVGGTNGTSALCTVNTAGGVTCTTTGVPGEQEGVQPHTTANISGWFSTLWPTDNELIWEGWCRAGTNIAAVIIGFGLKLTITPNQAPDADQIFFRYDDSNPNWQLVIERTNAPEVIDTLVPVVVNQAYHFKLVFLADRQVEVWVDDVLIGTVAAMTTAVNLLPMWCVEEQAGGAKNAVLVRQKLSRI